VAVPFSSATPLLHREGQLEGAGYMALTTVQAYQRELETIIAIEIERLIEPMANGFIETHEEYKSSIWQDCRVKSCARFDERSRSCLCREV